MNPEETSGMEQYANWKAPEQGVPEKPQEDKIATEVEGQEETETEQKKWENVTKKIQKLYIGLANEYLGDENILKKRIIDFYSDSDRLQGELQVVFKDLDEQGINKKIEEVKENFKDKTFFIEYHDKIFERIAVFQGIRKRMIEEPIATEEEYELGVYKEGLESQVRDAVCALHKKGYKTFESGFREKKDNRDQYIGMYNKKVSLPSSVINYFKEKQFTISVIKESDRTVINIHPENDNAVTVEDWKVIWDDLADKLPVAEEEDFDDVKIYGLHKRFRDRQNTLRK
jgi:hypothetical protein